MWGCEANSRYGNVWGSSRHVLCCCNWCHGCDIIAALSLSLSLYIYIYIYIQAERTESDKNQCRKTQNDDHHCACSSAKDVMDQRGHTSCEDLEDRNTRLMGAGLHGVRNGSTKYCNDIWDLRFKGSIHEECRLLGCGAEWVLLVPTFRRNMPLRFQGTNSERARNVSSN
jgi:hypothetical protein